METTVHVDASGVELVVEDGLQISDACTPEVIIQLQRFEGGPFAAACHVPLDRVDALLKAIHEARRRALLFKTMLDASR